MDLGTIVDTAFKAYSSLQMAHPIIGSVLTAEGTFIAGDITSQVIAGEKVDYSKIKYTAALAPIYGLGLYGLMESGELVGEYISGDPLAKAALGPNLLGNLYNTFFFVNNTVGEKKGYSLKKLAGHYWSMLSNRSDKSYLKNLKEKYIGNIPGKEYMYSMAATLTAWNVFQYFNYDCVPEEMRTPTTLAAGLVWTSLLSLWSLKGRRKVVNKEPR